MRVLIEFKCEHCGKTFKEEGEDTGITTRAHKKMKRLSPCKKAKAHLYKINKLEIIKQD
jgi:hypothetical protein